MKRKWLLLLISVLYCVTGLAQQNNNIGINITTPDPSAALHGKTANGEIIYVHPSNNQTYITWGENGNDIPTLTNFSNFDSGWDFDGELNTQKIVAWLQNYSNGYYPAKICAD